MNISNTSVSTLFIIFMVITPHMLTSLCRFTDLCVDDLLAGRKFRMYNTHAINNLFILLLYYVPIVMIMRELGAMLEI